MARAIVNSDNRLYDVLVNLKRHLGSCGPCRYAMRNNDRDMMCGTSIEMCLQAIKSYELIVKLRIDSRSEDADMVYPCPKISAHGKSYEQTAIPVLVTGYQGRLF